MARKKFNLQDYLANPEWEVEDINHNKGVVISSNLGGKYPILVQHSRVDGTTYRGLYTKEGYCCNDEDCFKRECVLFLVTPEPELTEWEESLRQRFFFGEHQIETSELKSIAAELLALARKELKDMIEFRGEEYQTGYKDGKSEALKDLPRWKISKCPRSNVPTLYLTNDGTVLYKDGHELNVSELDKLPKED